MPYHEERLRKALMVLCRRPSPGFMPIDETEQLIIDELLRGKCRGCGKPHDGSEFCSSPDCEFAAPNDDELGKFGDRDVMPQN